ncbi:putative signal transduction protein with CBS domains [Methanococcus vannielii SB]|jgi:CBS domain-containing protein|uniref:Signal transduction protein with CBS domains n=1 Tax=Methanococcus vannielii (strain ATCC 35089 / DSM 1224 / JCM 13029 / OCM 148 / SB) TaxID=406327 RepID=A6URR4_METVS|nr:CBS domain-containing protein [Methanococcus vannielii]ABR55186.1 putative signal transduction protein with CBS domains [Methanococcus vannielii SB]
MIFVKNVMKTPITLNKDDSIEKVIKLFREKSISGAPIVEGERIVGIISESDIIKSITSHDERVSLVLPSPFDLIELPLKTALKVEQFMEDIDNALKIEVWEAMTEKVITISPETTINKAAETMVKNKIKRLPVVENGKLVGIITRGDLIEAMV